MEATLTMSVSCLLTNFDTHARRAAGMSGRVRVAATVAALCISGNH